MSWKQSYRVKFNNLWLTLTQNCTKIYENQYHKFSTLFLTEKYVCGTFQDMLLVWKDL